jgi:hypothetical protein
LKDLADHLFDIIENSVNAGADEVIIKIAYKNSYFFCDIYDNGKGISGQEVLDPFVTSRKTRKVGLGLPLLKKAAEETGGNLEISRRNKSGGTVLHLKMDMSHIDARPFGDLARIFSDIFIAWPELNLKLFLLKKNDNDKEELILNFFKLRNDIELGLTNYLEVRKYIYEISQKELKEIGAI